MQFSSEVKITPAIAPSAGVAATTDINGATVDMAGFDSLLVTVVFGVITGSAVTSIKLQQDTASGMGTAADILGSAQTIADTDDDGTFYIDWHKPLERYVRLVVDRGTQNAVVSSATYFQYNAKNTPVTHTSPVSGELHISPIEGTA